MHYKTSFWEVSIGFPPLLDFQGGPVGQEVVRDHVLGDWGQKPSCRSDLMSSRDRSEVSEEEAEGGTGMGVGSWGRDLEKEMSEVEAQVTGSWQGFIHTQWEMGFTLRSEIKKIQEA